MRTAGCGPARTMTLLVLLSCLLAAGEAAALGVRHVGSITEGVFAPTGLVVGDGYVAAIEPVYGELVVYTAAGQVNVKAGAAPGAAALAALSGDRFLVVDPAAGAVDLIEPSTGLRRPFAGGIGDPRGVAVGNGEVFILDAARRRIVVLDVDGNPGGIIPLADPDPELPDWFAALAVDPARDLIHVVDQTNARILTFDRAGGVQAVRGGFGTHAGGISRPGAVACDADGWVLVADRYQGRVVVFDADGNHRGDVDPTDLGLGRLSLPLGLAIDAEGFLYVTAIGSATIEIFHLDKSAGPVPSLLARALSPAPGQQPAADDLRFEAGLQGPAALAGVLSAEFALVARSDTNLVLAGATGVPVEGAVLAGDLVVGKAVWEPDFEAEPGSEYGWRVRGATPDTSGTWTAWSWFVPAAVRLPYRLDQNAPNPFNPRTVIRFHLASAAPARLRILDVRGREVWSREVGDLGPGEHSILWRGETTAGNAAASGLYFYRLEAGSFAETRKMILAR